MRKLHIKQVSQSIIGQGTEAATFLNEEFRMENFELLMSWRDILKLLEQTGGNMEIIDPEKLQAAAAAGKGPPDVQKRIARAMYHQKYRKEIENGQIRWEFG